MPRGKMSAEAKARISQAQKERWARFHAQRNAGSASKTGRFAGRGRRGRPAGSGSSSSNANPYLNMTISQLVTAKRQLDEAWNMAVKMLRKA